LEILIKRDRGNRPCEVRQPEELNFSKVLNPTMAKAMRKMRRQIEKAASSLRRGLLNIWGFPKTIGKIS